MGVDFYDCYVCGDNGIYSEHLVRCEICLSHICTRCFGCQEGDTDFVNWKDQRLDEYTNSIKDGFCPSCKDNVV